MWCWDVLFWFMIFMVGWVVSEVRAPFVMNSWMRFYCTGFFCFFLVIPDGFEPLWSVSPPGHVSIASEDEQMLLPRQRINRLNGNVNRHCGFLKVNQFNLFFSEILEIGHHLVLHSKSTPESNTKVIINTY